MKKTRKVLHKAGHYSSNFWKYKIEIIAGLLMLIGIILSFFFGILGGALVGLGFGLGFFEELRVYFSEIRKHYSKFGIFKTLLVVGTVLFFLIAIPAFVIAAAIGFLILYFVRKARRHP